MYVKYDLLSAWSIDGCRVNALNFDMGSINKNKNEIIYACNVSVHEPFINLHIYWHLDCHDENLITENRSNEE